MRYEWILGFPQLKWKLVEDAHGGEYYEVGAYG